VTPERWRQITDLFHAALLHDASTRPGYLQQACGGDTALRAEIESMLDAHEATADVSESRASISIAHVPRLEPGAMIGPHRVQRLIGVGGMGEVYSARDSNLHRDVALKVLPLEFAVDADRLARFKREAHLLALISHPNIATIYGVEETGGVRALVLEYVEGQTLADRIALGPLPLTEALPIVRQIASALEAAHETGIIHRDLKPSNIKIRPNGAIKVLDFGLAKAMDVGLARQPPVDDTAVTVSQTEVGTVVGTAAYMAPEQALGKPVDARSDIFSFGSVVYEMLSGQRAFQGENPVAVMAAVIATEPPPLRAAPPLVQIVSRCLRKNPAERFASVAEIEAALETVDLRAVAPPSIAVLPFANLSADKENEYFSDGLTEEIINVLAQVSGLKVIARASAFAFRGKEHDIRAIAEVLGVRSILHGSVRRSGSRIRITAQLINADDGSLLWSERYDRAMADVFAIQDEIAQAIATALEVRLAGAPAPRRRYTPTLPAYDAHLKARFHEQRLTPESMARARQYFEQAIALDPGYALPLAELGGFFFNLANFGMMPAHEAMPLARAFARRARD
jgi:serine/threonine-protein kinase